MRSASAMEANSLDTEQRLRDSRWISRLALSMVGNRESAAELAQEAWMVARARQGSGGKLTSAWMGGVLRNLRRKRRRESARREHRERNRVLARMAPSTDELVMRAEAQQELTSAVLALPEPLKTTVLLRYFEDLSSEEVAKHMQVKADTVRGRTRRALEQLRTALGEDHDSRSSWRLGLLLPLPESLPNSLANSLGPQGPAIAAGMTMKFSTKVALGVLVVALGWGGWQRVGLYLNAPVEEAGLSSVTLESDPPAKPVPQEAKVSMARVDLPTDRATETDRLQSVGGRVSFLYPDGRRVDRADGGFKLSWVDDRGAPSSRALLIEDGRWSSSVFAGSSFVASEFWMQDRGERRHSREQVDLGADSLPIDGADLELGLEPRLRLHAVAPKTKTELLGVQVLDDASSDTFWPLVENLTRRLRIQSEGASPLSIPWNDESLARSGIWVGASDHGWKLLRLEPFQDHEVWLELPAAGDVHFIFDGDAPESDLELVLYRLDGPKGVRGDIGDDWEGYISNEESLNLTGLPVGRYRAVLQHRPTHSLVETRLGEASFEVFPGRRSTVHLSRDSLELRKRVEANLVLHLPAAWKVDEFRVTLEPIDVGATDSNSAKRWTQKDFRKHSSGVRSLDVGAASVGSYLIEFVAYPTVTYREVIELSADSPSMTLEVPDPVEVRGQVVDASTGLPLEVQLWVYGQGEFPQVSGSRGIPLEPSSKRASSEVVFRAPAGKLCVLLMTEDGRRHEAEARVAGSHHDWVVEVP